MKRMLGLTLGIAAISLSVLVAGTSSEKKTQKVEKVDLSDLRDGETRTLGKGDSSMTATRKGDEITIRHGGPGGEKQTIQCTVGKDSCYAMAVEGDGKAQVIIVDKSGKGGKEGEHLFIQEGDPVGEGMMLSGENMMLWVSKDDPAGSNVVIDATHPGTCCVGADGCDAHAGVKVIKIRDEAATLLECPEGDATLSLKKGEESSGPYFCPRHNVKMEEAKLPTIMKRVEVKVKGDDKEE